MDKKQIFFLEHKPLMAWVNIDGMWSYMGFVYSFSNGLFQVSYSIISQ